MDRQHDISTLGEATRGGKEEPTSSAPDPDVFNPDHITWSIFHRLLACYPVTVEAVTRRKATERVSLPKGKKARAEMKAQIAAGAQVQLDQTQLRQVDEEVQAYLELDEWRYCGLPAVVERDRLDEKWLDWGEVVRLVEWKMKHGVFRPALLGMVKSNQEKLVRKITQDAFASLISEEEESVFPRIAMDTLTRPLRGVGPATASLLLSLGGPADTPFYSDDVYLWLCWREFPLLRSDASDGAVGEPEKMNEQESQGRVHLIRDNGEINVKYNIKEYEELWDAVTALRTRLNKDRSSWPEKAEGITCVDVEKVAFVLRHIEVSGYSKTDQKKPDSVGVEWKVAEEALGEGPEKKDQDAKDREVETVAKRKRGDEKETGQTRRSLRRRK